MAAKLSQLLSAVTLGLALLVATSLGMSGSALGAGADTTKSVDKSLPSPDDFIAVDTQPVQETQVSPTYPDSAKKAGIEGTVWVRVLVDKEGKVRDVGIVKNSGKNVGFEDAATAAARQCTWKPALLKGQPVAVWVSYQVKFALGEK